MSPSVGCRLWTIPDPDQPAGLSSVLLYPTDAPERQERFGPYSLDVALDAPVAPGRMPLIVVSHGNAASPWTLRDAGAALVRAGFLVCLLEHTGNSRTDNSLERTEANLLNRPRHVSLAIEAIFADPDLGRRVMPEVGLLGISIGAYTALAAAGGRPWAAPHETPDGSARPLGIQSNPRIRAIALLAPATFWFAAPDALSDVTARIAIWSGDRDEITGPEHAARVLQQVPPASRAEHRVVRNAGHFSFLSPFPDAMAAPGFPPSQDPAGFDRRAFQAGFHDQLVSFFIEAIGAPQSSSGAPNGK